MLVSPAASWPVAKDHGSGESGDVFDPTGERLVHGALIGDMALDKDDGSDQMNGPFGYEDPAKGRVWGKIDTYLPLWDYGAVTYSIYPMNYVKIGAVHSTPTAKVDKAGATSTRTIDLLSNSKYIIDTPFQYPGSTYYCDGEDTLTSPKFTVGNGGSVRTKPYPVQSFSWTPNYPFLGSTSNCNENDVENLQSPPFDATGVQVTNNVAMYKMIRCGEVGGLNIAVTYDSTFGFILPFDDSRPGDYELTLTMWTPSEFLTAGPCQVGQLGPYDDEVNQGGAILADNLNIHVDNLGSFNSPTSWTGEPPSSKGGQNIPTDTGLLATYTLEDADKSIGFKRTTFPALKWTQPAGTTTANHLPEGIVTVGIDADLEKAPFIFGLRMIYVFLAIDYMTLELSFTPKGALPYAVNINDLSSTSSWQFSGTFPSGTSTWSITPSASLTLALSKNEIVAFSFTLGPISANYGSHDTGFDRIKGMSLNGALLEEGAGFLYKEFPDLDTQSFFERNPKPRGGFTPDPPVDMARVCLDVSISAYKNPVYNYDYVIFKFAADYGMVSAPFDIPFTGYQSGDEVLFRFPAEMGWLPGGFDFYSVAGGPYIVTFWASDLHGYRDPSEAPKHMGWSADLPLWAMKFPLYKGWSMSAVAPLSVKITLDGGEGSLPTFTSLSWPAEDGSQVLREGQLDFGFGYSDDHTPVIGGILWWERLDGTEVVERGSVEDLMPGTFTGETTRAIYPIDFASGFYRFLVEIVDGAGNYQVSEPRTYEFIMQDASPRLEMRTPGVAAGDMIVYGGAAGVPTFDVEAKDSDLDPASVKVTVDGIKDIQLYYDAAVYGYCLSETQGSHATWDDWCTYYQDEMGEGEHVVEVFASDTFTPVHTSSLVFTLVKDFSSPSGILLGPVNGAVVASAPTVSMHVTETMSFIQDAWYSFAPGAVLGDSSWHVVSIGPIWTGVAGEDITFAVAPEDWAAHVVGEVSFQLSCTVQDAGGNYAPVAVLGLTKDTIAPNLIVDLPAVGGMFTRTAPGYRLLLAGGEPHLSSIGYAIRGVAGTIQIPTVLCEWSEADQAYVYLGSIEPALWASAGDTLGWETDIEITFTATDSAANRDVESRSVGLDALAPRISVITPVPGSFVGAYATSYLIKVDDAHLEGLWVSLDNGTTFLPITDMSGVFNQDQWDAAAGSRVMTIVFKGRDTLGNEATVSAQVRRMDFDEGDLPWQVLACMAAAGAVTFAINAVNKKRQGGR